MSISKETTVHFGKTLRAKDGGHRLTRDNYCRINTKSSFGNGRVYTDEWCQKHIKKCMINFDKNIDYFSNLNRDDFAADINNFIKNNSFFHDVKNISDCNGLSGCYVMVLDEYCQVYVGISKNIGQRIGVHWSKTKEFDRLIYGNVNTSKISIDSFRALDTTRLFIFESDNDDELVKIEDEIMDQFDPKFISNRIYGGTIDGGLSEVRIGLIAKLRSLM